MVDGSGLENRRTRKGTGGSNPSLSAITFVIYHLQAGDIYTDINVEDHQRIASATSPSESRQVTAHATAPWCFPPMDGSSRTWFYLGTRKSATPKARTTFRGTRESGLSGSLWAKTLLLPLPAAFRRKLN